MSFAAKYTGYCAGQNCADPIDPGDEVEYVDDELMHTSCASHARREPPLCKECFTYHNGECG